LIEKCKTRNSKYEVSLDKNYPNDVIIWAAIMPLDVERLAEDLNSRFGNNVVGDVGIKYYSSYGDILNRQEFIPEIKEKFKIENGFILTDGHNYKLMSLFRLYIDIYYNSNYKNDMHMGELYVKRRVAEYRKVNFNDYVDIKAEIVDGYMEIYMEYVVDGKLPPVHSDFFWIFQQYIEHNGVQPSKEIKMKINWDDDTNNKIFLFRS
jgi:hypothetical protein